MIALCMPTAILQMMARASTVSVLQASQEMGGTANEVHTPFCAHLIEFMENHFNNLNLN